jgi:hypothetical protein
MPDFPACIVWRIWCWFLTCYWLSCYKTYSFCCDCTVCICGAKCWNFYSQLIKKFGGFMKFRVHHWILFWNRWSIVHLQAHFLCDIYIAFIYHQVDLMRFSNEYYAFISYMSCVYYVSYLFSSLDYKNWWTVQIMKPVYELCLMYMLLS